MLNKMMATLLTEDAQFREDMAASQVKIEDRLWYGEPYGVRLTAPVGCPATFDQLRELAEAHLGKRVDHTHTVYTWGNVEHDPIEGVGADWRPFEPRWDVEAVCIDIDHPTSGEVPEWRKDQIRGAVDAAIAAARGTSDRVVALLVNDEWHHLPVLASISPEDILNSRRPEVVRESSLVLHWEGDWSVSTGKGGRTCILWDDSEGYNLTGAQLPSNEYVVALEYAKQIAIREIEYLADDEWDALRETAKDAIRTRAALEAAQRRESTREARRAFYARVKAGDVTIADVAYKTGWCIAGIAEWMGLPDSGDIKIEVRHLLGLVATRGDYYQRLEVVLD